jgi:hypothetical protein
MAAQLQFGPGNSVGFGTTGTGTGTTAIFSRTALCNAVIGDLLVAWIHNQSAGVTGTITPPTGWIRYGAAMGTSTWAISRTSGVYYYPIKTQADLDNIPASVQWTFSLSGSRVACVVARATGINLNSIEDSASTAFQGGSTNPLTITGITTVSATTLLVGGLHHQNSASTTAPSTTAFMSSFQEYLTVASDTSVANTGGALGYTYLTSAGATGNVTGTFSTSVAAAGGELVAFKAGSWTLPDMSVTRPTAIGVATTFATPSAVTTFAVSKPSGIIDGDLLVLAVSAQTQTATADFSSSGWTRISKPFAGSSSTYRLMAFYARPVASASALSSTTSFTFTSTDSGSGGRVAAEMFIVRGADLTNITTATSPYGVAGTLRTVTVQPDAPLTTNNLLLTAYGAQFTSAIDYTIQTGPSGMTQHVFLPSSVTAVNKTILAVYRQDTEAGSPGNKSLTWNGVQSQTSGVAVAIRSNGMATPNPGQALHYTSAPSTLAAGHLFYTSAPSTMSTPKEIRAMPTGYASVTAMLASTPFYIAHRGGSVDWPEMSLFAYTQSAFWGVGALEISMQRTSDGVWFGLHDETLDRTSGTTNFYAAQHTWAEVQAYQISAANTTDTTQPARPYMRWEELMSAYYGTHVIMVDPKNAVGFMTELLDMMDAQPGSPTTQFVAKYYGVVSAWPAAARARGYKAWGYFYQSDSANFNAYQGNWDILGMDFNADQATWTTILSYGKPVIAHTVPDGAAATTALNFGAAGMMVSGVQETIPRSANPSG